MQSSRREDEEDSRPESRVGMRVKRKPLETPPDGFTVLVDSSATSFVLKDKEMASFMATLTPGAQNAIHAASFAWGYENAVKSLKTAMKVDEVKNALDPVEKSKAVMESMQSQLGQSEKSSEVSKFVWSYYNEDMKEVQAQATRSEAMTEKVHQPEQERMLTPATAQEAVCMSVTMGTHSPSLLYCAGSPQAVQQMHESQAAIMKREELARLVKEERIRTGQPGEQLTEAQRLAISQEETGQVAMQRKEELVEEYQKLEHDLQNAIRVLDKFTEQEKDKVKKIAAMLPSELSRFLTMNEKLFTRKIALRSQLSKWLAFSRQSKDSLSKLSAPRLLKLASLSTLLKLGK